MQVGMKSGAVLAVLLGLTVLVFAGGASAGATASIHPRVTYASVGNIVKVDIWKDAADTLFDGYETVIRWNTSDLQLQSGTAQESVMTANCSNRWWYLTPGTDNIFISHVRMCPPNTLVSGPGALSSLRFKVLREGRLVITKDYFWFTRAGYWIQDVTWQDGVILAGATAGVGPQGTADSAPMCVSVVPNPGREISVTVQCNAHMAEGVGLASVCVYDIGGRLVRTLQGGASGDGPSALTWDGMDVDGKVCAPGVYYLDCRSGNQAASRSVVLVK